MAKITVTATHEYTEEYIRAAATHPCCAYPRGVVEGCRQWVADNPETKTVREMLEGQLTALTEITFTSYTGVWFAGFKGVVIAGDSPEAAFAALLDMKVPV